MENLRKYWLGSTGGLNEKTYELVFSGSGEMYVQYTIDYDQPYRKDGGGTLKAENFSNHHIYGVSLLEIVRKKLLEILPPPEPSQSCIKPEGVK